LSAALNEENEWNFRVTDQRLIVVKTKNESVRQVAALDVLTNVPIALKVSPDVPLESLQLEKEYLAHLKVYTFKNLEGVDVDFLGFFEALDIDQNMEDVIRAYWVYPGKIRFDLESVEDP
jgi:hypothetical protein